KRLKEKKIDQIHLIVNEPHRKEYERLRAVGKGGFFDFKVASTVSPTNKGFASLLPVLSQGITESIEAAGPATPTATAPPAPPAAAPPQGKSSGEPPPPKPAPPQAPPTVPTPPPPVAGVTAPPQVGAPQLPEAANPVPPQADLSGLKGLQSTELISEKHRLRLLLAIALWTAAVAGGIGLALVVGQK